MSAVQQHHKVKCETFEERKTNHCAIISAKREPLAKCWWWMLMQWRAEPVDKDQIRYVLPFISNIVHCAAMTCIKRE